MAATTELGRNGGVDTKELRKLTKDFKGWNPDKQLKKALRTAGELIKADAKVIVERPSKYHYISNRNRPRRPSHEFSGVSRGSTSVPPTIKVRLSKTRVSVVAGGAEVPLGGLLEMGNRRRGKSAAASKGGVFRHPVFGNKDRWVYQGMNPYLLPAAEQNKRGIEALEGKAVAEAFKESDFTVSR